MPAPRAVEDLVARGVPEPPASFVPVPGVSDFLERVPDMRVSVVVSPAGTGKTTMAAAWATREASDVRVQWVDLGSLDRVASGQRQHPLWGATSPRDDPTHGTAHVVVIDDAHLLTTADRASLTHELEAGVGDTHFLILSRDDLSLVPVSLELAGDVQTLRFPELRLDDATAAELVRLHHSSATPDQVAEVVRRSSGWAAVLVLGARSLHGSAPPPPLSRVPSHPILDFVTSELVDELPDPLVEVLAATCWQPDLTDEDAVVLSGDAGAPDELAAAAADGLVVCRAHGAGHGRSTRWRVHPLVGEALRRRSAPGGRGRAAVVRGHERALHHYERTGDLAAALRHATLTGDATIQLSTLTSHAFGLIAHDRVAPVQEALAHLPPEVRQSDRSAQALDAFILRGAGRWEEAKRLADLALSPVPVAEPGQRPDSRDADLATDLAILDTWRARFGGRPIGPALVRASAALGCQHDADPPELGHDPPGGTTLRTGWLMVETAELQVWADQLDAAAVHVHDAARVFATYDVPRVTTALLVVRATLELVQGAYQTALGTADDALALAAEAGYPPTELRVRAHLVRGWARFHDYDVEGARADLADAVVQHVPLDPLSQGYRDILAGKVAMAEGAVEEARRLLDAEAFGPLPLYLERHLRIARFRAAGFMGDLPAMEAEANAMRHAGLEWEAVLVHAVVLGLDGHEQEAIRMLDALLARTDSRGRQVVRLTPEVATFAAAIRVALLQRLGTADALDRAASLVPDLLTRTATHRLLWVLSGGRIASPAFLDLLMGEAARPDGHPFATEALETLARRERPYPAELIVRRDDLGAVQDLGETLAVGLTRREHEVLRAVALGGSNATVGTSLFISENTVKTHLAALYRKLGVQNREEAVAQARRLGLV
ncbi:LuxR C-terminal-related transcriptional regulator [Nocardioides sediminis]|uniref:LuxR C-terminal-related transcriptional regulator n=1 Tax=Nocardioides sediminis TaxID=433648 RepID=UPI000D31EE67|nr:LuxR C-terminal-related transcriptional regulator [Nocardioides sediminis]